MNFKPRDPRPGEPVFTLLGGDPAAPAFVRAYAYYIQGQTEMAERELLRYLTRSFDDEPAGSPKVRSAFELADRMEMFQRAQALSEAKRADPVEVRDRQLMPGDTATRTRRDQRLLSDRDDPYNGQAEVSAVVCKSGSGVVVR